MRPRRALFSWVFCCWFIAITKASAVLLLHEPFNYTNTALVTASAGVWTNHSGPLGEVQIVSRRAVLDRNLNEDVNVTLAGQPYPSDTNTVLYASFTVNVSTLPSSGGQYFAHFKAGGLSNFRAKVFALTSGASGGQYRLAISGSSNDAVATNLTSLSLNTDYRVFIRYGVSNATATLWVDPTSEASPSVTATDASPASLTSFALREDNGIGVLTVDDLRIGTSFAEVYADIPPSITQQPASVMIFAGNSASFTVTATGTTPLSYQWKFNNTNLPAVTSASLILNNVSVSQAGPYSVTITNIAGATNSATATLTVNESNNGLLTVVHYNVKGNFASDWTTNAPQVQAITRQLQYLNPDIITLNEIPHGFRHEMTNWMTAFFPGRNLAISPGTDGVLRSGVISRYSITRSNSYFENFGLTNFGFSNTFTRDLFETEIAVPGYPQPLHVFTTHLKSGSTASDNQRRAAEANCISNFFVNGWLTTNYLRPYLLMGDLNEDIARPPGSSQQAIQRLTNGTGLMLTTPVSITNSDFTHSIQGSLDNRFDYIMPAGVLRSNIVSSQVFRTDLLNPVPLNLNSNDDIVASDHLPVVMVFSNPYDKPFHLLSVAQTNETVTLRWQSVPGQSYAVLQTTNLAAWDVLASGLVATNYSFTFTANATARSRFFRIFRDP